MQVLALRGDTPENCSVAWSRGNSSRLSGVSFNASVFLAKEQLEGIAQKHGRPVTFADLNALLREANAQAISSSRHRAIIPPQNLGRTACYGAGGGQGQ